MQKFSPIQYLKIDIASNFGLDKLDWADRIDWVDAHEDELERLLKAAEEPALYHAGVQAYRKAQRGEPTGYPVSLDAASSGLQILACLTGCEASAKLCGVVSTGHRADAYTILYRVMCDTIGDATKIQRKDVKQAIMTSLYSSEAIPKKVFGEGELLRVFYETMEREAPGAWALNHALKALWQPYALSHDWVMPDNFHVHIPVMEKTTKYIQVFNQPVAVDLKVNMGTKEGRSLSPNVVHSIDGMIVREIHRRCSYDSSKMIQLLEDLQYRARSTSETRDKDSKVKRLWALYEASGFLSSRILDYLDRYNLNLVDREVIKSLVKSMPETPFPVISIHDCFRAHPNHMNDLRAQYNKLLSEIAGSNLLAFIASQITGSPVPVVKRGDLSQAILEADYALC